MGPEVKYDLQSLNVKEATENKCIYTVTYKKTNSKDVKTVEVVLTRGNGDFVISEIRK